jgi:hypothetical protein
LFLPLQLELFSLNLESLPIQISPLPLDLQFGTASAIAPEGTLIFIAFALFSNVASDRTSGQSTEHSTKHRSSLASYRISYAGSSSGTDGCATESTGRLRTPLEERQW